MPRRDSIFDSDQVTITTQSPVGQPRGGDDRQACLLVLSGASVGRVFQLSDLTTIGRDPNADIQLMDAGISRQHAMLRRTDNGRYVLSDAGSRNGTFANSERIEEPHLLTDSDKVQIGAQTILKFTYSDELETSYAQKMYDVALRDGLTGLFNRRYFDERLETEIAFTKRHDKPLALLLMDVDHFKQVNDTYGHPAGDKLLVELSALLAATVRNEDVLVRYGGEEFAIICRTTNALKASVLAERIRYAAAAQTFLLDEHAIRLTVSIGVVAFPSPGTDSGVALVDAADQALYQAKAKGRNCVVTRRGD